MSAPDRISGDRVYAGSVRFIGPVTIPDGTVTDAKVSASAGIAYTKLQHEHRLTYAQDGTAADAEAVVYRCRGATGGVIEVHAGSIGAAVGDSTVTVDLEKNGTSILTGPITLDSSTVAYTGDAGTLDASPTLAAGDVLSVVIDATVGTGTLPTGVYVAVSVYEDAA